ncbi:hypothetical protein ACTMU2_18415 [Cupriavidus basilensis]
MVVVNEGQGPLFRCPICGARNALAAREEGRRDRLSSTSDDRLLTNA